MSIKEKSRLNRGYKRFQRWLNSRRKKKRKAKIICEENTRFNNKYGRHVTVEQLLTISLSSSVTYLFDYEYSQLNFSLINQEDINASNLVKIPSKFSLMETPKESYSVIRRLVALLLYSPFSEIIIDYTGCTNFTLEAQVLLDLILKDIFKFYSKCNKKKRFKKYSKSIADRTIGGSSIRTMLFSVGSLAIHAKKQTDFPHVIPYNLCIHNSEINSIRQAEMKDIDTTTLSDYVDECLAKMGRSLDAVQSDDLCTVIGEILINAEEHSSTKCRYSIGYFEEENIKGEKQGKFQLVIMNIGRSIYEKFKDKDCPNPTMSEKMRELSRKYTERGFLKSKSFEEETLWTLYSLQDGVTSVSPEKYKNRGNGSLRFIESFYKLKGDCSRTDESRMTLQSGKANIVFDGQYPITETIVKDEKYRVLTFNETGNIEDKPNSNYVKCSEYFFPGTFIHANIYL
jgi:hypothetical protein